MKDELRTLAYLILANIWYATAMVWPGFGKMALFVGSAYLGLTIYYMFKVKQDEP